MDFIYVLIDEWDDLVIFLSKEELIESIKYPKSRIEIFSKNDKMEYTPIYNYYKNGNYELGCQNL